MAEQADATDLKSVGAQAPCRFDSGLRHHNRKCCSSYLLFPGYLKTLDPSPFKTPSPQVKTMNSKNRGMFCSVASPLQQQAFDFVDTKSPQLPGQTLLSHFFIKLLEFVIFKKNCPCRTKQKLKIHTKLSKDTLSFQEAPYMLSFSQILEKKRER